MRFFTKNTEAKARRTQELEEQHKKEKAVPPPYVHTPTHALKDSLQSVPDVNKGTDKQRLKEAHRQRLEREVSALAAGSDTNATKTPANYWQGQPLPAQFKAPTPAGLRKLALSRAALRGKKTALPQTLPANKQSQAPIDDEGYASGHELNGTAKRSRKGKGSATGPSRGAVTTRPRRHEAAEAGGEDELERLRRRVKELEEKERGKQNEQRLAGLPIILTRAIAHDSSSRKPDVGGARPHTVGPEVGLVDDLQSRTSSSERWQSERWQSLSSGKDRHSTPPTTPSPMNSDGVKRYDWVMHWKRLEARTKEETDKLPPAFNPQQRSAPVPTLPTEAEDQPRHVCPRNYSRKISAGPEHKPSSSSDGHRSTRTRDGTVVTLTWADEETKTGGSPTCSEMDEYRSALGSTRMSSATRPSNYSTRAVGHADKAETRRKQR